jgi:hypothetical protein
VLKLTTNVPWKIKQNDQGTVTESEETEAKGK